MSKKSIKIVAVTIMIIMVTPLLSVFAFAADFTVTTDFSAADIADMNVQGAWVVSSGSNNATLLAVALPDNVTLPSDVALALIFNGQNIGISATLPDGFNESYTLTVHQINLISGNTHDTSMSISNANATDGVVNRGIISLGSDNTTMYYAYALSGYRYSRIVTGTYLMVSAPFVIFDGGQVSGLDGLFTFFSNCIHDIVSTITSSPILMISLGVLCVGAVIGLGYRLIRG